MTPPGFAVLPAWVLSGVGLTAGLLLGLCDLSGTPPVSDIRSEAPPYRLAMTSSVFLGVNQNDARSAMSVWISTLAKNLSISVDSDITHDYR